MHVVLRNSGVKLLFSFYFNISFLFDVSRTCGSGSAFLRAGIGGSEVLPSTLHFPHPTTFTSASNGAVDLQVDDVAPNL